MRLHRPPHDFGCIRRRILILLGYAALRTIQHLYLLYFASAKRQVRSHLSTGQRKPSFNALQIGVNPTNLVTMQDTIQGAEAAARRLGLEIIVVKASTENEIEMAFATAVQKWAGGLVANDAYFESRRDQIAALGLRHALPTSIGSRESVAAGSLMSY